MQSIIIQTKKPRAVVTIVENEIKAHHIISFSGDLFQVYEDGRRVIVSAQDHEELLAFQKPCHLYEFKNGAWVKIVTDHWDIQKVDDRKVVSIGGIIVLSSIGKMQKDGKRLTFGSHGIVYALKFAEVIVADYVYDMFFK